jgi:DNA-binding cell septation regulator SpoVG
MTSQAENPPPEIEVTKIRHLQGRGNLRAFVSIRYSGLVLHGFRVIRQPGQRPYVSLPQQESKGKFYPIIQAEDNGLSDAIKATVLSAWTAENNGGSDEPEIL